MGNIRKMSLSKPGIALLILVLILIIFYVQLQYAVQGYEDLAKRNSVSELYSKFNDISIDITKKVVNKEWSPTLYENWFQAIDLNKYGIKKQAIIEIGDDDKVKSFKIMRQIEVTPSEIIIKYGPGFDGKKEKTFILKVSEETIWSCSGGSLANKYRPEQCRK